jgi:Tetratricopeptide repeat
MNKGAELGRLADCGEWDALEPFLRENLAELMHKAIGLAYEHSEVATILARLMEQCTDIDLVADAYNAFHHGPVKLSGLPEFPAGNVAFGEVAIAIGRKVLRIALAQPDLSRLRAEGAPMFTNLAGWLNIVGRRDEAVDIAREAVTFFSHGANSDNPGEIGGYADSLDSLMITLRQLGLRQEADDAGRGAIARYRRLVEIDADANRARLARGLVNWAGGLPDVGSHEVRITTFREAVALYSEAGTPGHGKFDPELCQTLIGFTSVLVDAENLNEALKVATKAYEIANTLSGRSIQGYGQLRVMAMTNHALVHQRRGETKDAVDILDSAVRFARALHDDSPRAFDELFAKCLGVYARTLVDAKDLEKAFESLDECDRECVASGKINDHDFLAKTYINFAILASETGRPERLMRGVTQARSALDHLSSADPDWLADCHKTLRQLEALVDKAS